MFFKQNIWILCKYNLQFLAKMYTVTDDNKKESHPNYTRDFFIALFQNVLIGIK